VSEPPTVVRRDGLIVLTLHEREVQILQWVFTDLGRMLAAWGREEDRAKLRQLRELADLERGLALEL
jgi:hypothetical protein